MWGFILSATLQIYESYIHKTCVNIYIYLDKNKQGICLIHIYMTVYFSDLTYKHVNEMFSLFLSQSLLVLIHLRKTYVYLIDHFTIAFISICTGTNTCIASYMNRSQTPVELPDMMQCHEYFINPCLCLSHFTSLSAFSHLFSQVFCSTEQSVITEKRFLPQCQFLKRS